MKAKKVIFSILGFLVLAAGIVAGTYLVQKNQDIREKAAPATSLSFIPSSVTKNPGQTFSLTINADSGENKITGIDIEVSFDPSVIQLTDMSPTAQISALSTVLKDGEINNTTGKARFAAFTAVKANAVFGDLDMITLTGTVSGSAANNTYPITFTASTSIAAADEGQNVVINSAPGNLIVSSGSSATTQPTATATSVATASPTADSGVGGAQITLPTATPTSAATTKATVKPTSTSSSDQTVEATLPPDLPVTGVSLPLIGSVGLGLAALIFSLFLVF